MITNFIDYKDAVERSESVILDERVKAEEELKEFRNFDRNSAYYYKKWLEKEKRDDAEVKPTRAVNPTKASKTATKGKDKPVTMSYDDFKWNFDHIGKSNLYSPDNKSPMVRISEFSRSDPEKYAEYRDRMRKENG